jgi:hypothetical protein
MRQEKKKITGQKWKRLDISQTKKEYQRQKELFFILPNYFSAR